MSLFTKIKSAVAFVRLIASSRAARDTFDIIEDSDRELIIGRPGKTGSIVRVDKVNGTLLIHERTSIKFDAINEFEIVRQRFDERPDSWSVRVLISDATRTPIYYSKDATNVSIFAAHLGTATGKPVVYPKSLV